MEFFVAIVHHFHVLIIVTKSSILDLAVVFYTSLITKKSEKLFLTLCKRKIYITFFVSKLTFKHFR